MTQMLHNNKVKDSSSKAIFEDPVLCSQFLRGYVDIPVLKNVRPEDIEDVTERFVHMFTEERNADTVKKVYTEINDTPFFLISLIEHKAKVDYNVVMQILRYMVFIWEDYEKEMEAKQKGISRSKGFKYPPVLPIIFYDGVDNWTAAVKLHEKIFLSDIFMKFIPDYQCILVQLKDYSNEELMKKKDELSIVMLIDRLKDAADYRELGKKIREGYLAEVTTNAPEYLLDIIAQVVEILLVKLNVPDEETEAFIGQIKERKMGELLANFQGWDVQAIRKEAREEARKEARKEIWEEAMEEARKEIREEARREIQEDGVKKMIQAFKTVVSAQVVVKKQLVEQYGLSEEEAAKKIELYW